MRYEAYTEIQQNYSLKSLEDSLEAYQREIDRIGKQVAEITAQLMIVKKTAFKKIVRLQKFMYFKPVKHSVTLYYVPDIKGSENTYYPSDFCKIFEGGKRRKEAIEYALELAKEHNAELVKEGM